MKDKKMESRITGAMLALACGDALGAPAEFKNQAKVKAEFGILKDMISGGIWEPGETTDDSGMPTSVPRSWPAALRHSTQYKAFHEGSCILPTRQLAKHCRA